jgi:hypothetical protein
LPVVDVLSRKTTIKSSLFLLSGILFNIGYRLTTFSLPGFFLYAYCRLFNALVSARWHLPTTEEFVCRSQSILNVGRPISANLPEQSGYMESGRFLVAVP